MRLEFRSGPLDLERPRVMGVLNVTPDSFSDGGLYLAHERAIEHGLQMVAAGADIIDVGGESTRPGARTVSAAEEIDRVVGVVEGLAGIGTVPVSIDTSKPGVMEAAVAAGAELINDVRALREQGALAMALQLDVCVCLMHMQGEPGTMQDAPAYTEVVGDVAGFLAERARACVSGGMSPERLLLDPGFGFGKTLEHNLCLLRRLDDIVALGFPVLAGLSRKSMIAAIMEKVRPGRLPDARDRVGGSVTLAMYAVRKGAHIVRVHDVRETVEALAIQAVLDNDAGQLPGQ